MDSNSELPTKRSTSGRKQWTVHDNSDCLMQRLHSQLARDGCPESQFVLAKQLLDDDADIEDKEENAKLGIYWLIKASEQGNMEATNLLKECLQSGKGLSEHNYLDVKACIEMSQDEKLARKAAREMFASMSNGGEYITSNQLQRTMLMIEEGRRVTLQNGHKDWELIRKYHEVDSDEDTDWSQRSDTNEKLTEDHLIDAAVHYSHGQLPLVNNVLCLAEPNLEALDHIPYVHRSILHPILALKILYYKIIRFLAKCSCSMKFFDSNLKFIYIMALYVLLGLESVYYVFPMIAYYLTIVVMVFNTFRMLQTQREFFDFRIWSGLFITYSRGYLNAEQAEFQYVRNNLRPFAYFFISLMVNFLVYPAVAENCYIPESEITLLAFCLTFITLFGFMYKKRNKTVWNLWILLSFSINVLAKYPYHADSVVTQGWRFLDLNTPTFFTYIIGNGIEFCINFQTLLYCCIPIVMLQIGRQENWCGIYKYLIPHCVTLSWFQIVVISSQGATMYGLIRGTLALVGFVMFLPLVGLTSIILPAAALSKWLISNDTVLTWAVCAIIGILGISVCYSLAKSRLKKYTAMVQTCIALLTIYFVIDSMSNQSGNFLSTITLTPKTLSYEQYQKFCHEQAWRQENLASSQIRCAKLQNVAVSWTGYVHQVHVKATRNPYKYFLRHLPVPDNLKRIISCLFGEKTENICASLANSEECLIFHDVVRSNEECHLDMHDLYQFEIVAQMHSGIWGKGAEIRLDTDWQPEFTNFVLKLRQDDQIWFKGTLVNAGTRNVGLTLESLGCITCQDSSLNNLRVKREESMIFNKKMLVEYLKTSLRNLLNVIFAPLIVFK